MGPQILTLFLFYPFRVSKEFGQRLNLCILFFFPLAGVCVSVCQCLFVWRPPLTRQHAYHHPHLAHQLLISADSLWIPTASVSVPLGHRSRRHRGPTGHPTLPTTQRRLHTYINQVCTRRHFVRPLIHFKLIASRLSDNKTIGP